MNIPNKNHYLKTVNEIDKIGINRMWLYEDVSNYFGKIADEQNAKYWLNFTTQLIYVNSTEVMSNIIKLGVNKNFFSYIKLIYEGACPLHNIFGNLAQPEFSVLDSTLFVVENL